MITETPGKPRAVKRWRAALYGLAATLLGGLLMLLGAQTAFAHAELLGSTPEDGAVLDEAPAEVVFTFNEPVQLLDESVRLFFGDDPPTALDARVNNTDVVAPLPATLEQGRYAVSYRVVSADGHPVAGALTFTIGEHVADVPTPNVEIPSPRATEFAASALTAIEYIGILIFAGFLLCERLVLGNTHVASPGSARVLRYSGIAAIGASLLFVPVSALNILGEPLWAIFSPGAWWRGVLWAPVAVAALIAFGVVTGSMTLRSRHGFARSFALLPPLLALAAPVLIGHSQLKEPRLLIMVADIGHLLAGAFWSGGVIGLVLFLATAFRSAKNPEGADPLEAARVVQRFSGYAIWSVILLAVSGSIMGFMILDRVDQLATTSYGLTLLLKVGVVAATIVIASYNRFLLLPVLRTRVEEERRWGLLRRTLGYEAALLVTVLLITGFLTNLSPNHSHHAEHSQTSAVAETVDIEAHAQGLTVRGTLSPALTGDNTIEFVLESDGEEVSPEQVTVRVSLAEEDLGPFEVPAERDAEIGGYVAELLLPVSGDWEVQVIARVSRFSEPIVTIPVTVQ